MTRYSAFFSSGLLASRNLPTSYDSDASSPVFPSSPLSDSDIELDTNRERTPTPDNVPRAVPAAQQPRLRKRRSSLTIATSPMNTIRSPQRNASSALHLQMHLSSPSRSRSGSLSSTGTNIASHSTSLVGRMRSGSFGTAQCTRRTVRRLVSVPAPAPPPTVPLPAVPALLFSPSQSWFNAPHTAPLTGSFPKSSFLTSNHVETRTPLVVRPTSDHVPHPIIKGRQRGFSLSEGLTIDEEMKEN